MGNLDDGPEQKPLAEKQLEESILSLLPKHHYDLIITHSPAGEYTRHKRHEEIGQAVFDLWENEIIKSSQLWLFAYEDHNQAHYPQAISKADRIIKLPQNIWRKKYFLITQTYRFLKNSFEAWTTPEKEAFWCFKQGKTIQNGFLSDP